MPISKILSLKPGEGLDAGIFPSAEDTVGYWGDARNAWFRELDVRHAPGQVKIANVLSRAPRALAQAYVQGKKRLYFEDAGIISFTEDGGASQIIGTLDGASTSYYLEPWGDWLVATDNISQLKLWKNTATFIDIATGEFTTAKIVKKLAQHLIAYSTDVFPNGFHWCSASDPETWTPLSTNSARNLPIRNLDSDIIAVADLASNHAVYSRNYMLPVQYIGPNDWFGTPANALFGIGAVSKTSVVNLGRFNWGLCRSGVFQTDGNSFVYVDRPAVDGWIKEEIDWARENEVVGYFDNKLLLILWSVPLLSGGKTVIAVDPKDRQLLTDKTKRPFTFMTGDYGSAMGAEVLDYPIVGRADGVFSASVEGTVMGDFYLQAGLFDAGANDFSKTWAMAKFEGTIADAEVRFGFTDAPKLDTLDWGPWTAMTFEFPLPGGPRESIYLAFEIRSTTEFRMSGFTMYGHKAGATT